MLKGHTRNIPLSNIMQTLVLNQQGGILSVQFQKMERHLAIGASSVSLVTERPYTSSLLQQTLARLAILSGTEYQNVVSTTSGAHPPGDALLARHLLTAEQVTSLVREQFQEAIYEIFEWRNASYSFDVHPIHEDRVIFGDAELAQGLQFPVNGILMEVARREDEWVRIRESIPHAQQIYTIESEKLDASDIGSTIALSADRFDSLKQMLNSELTLEEVLERSSIPPFFVFSTLRHLLEEGFARPLDIEEKKELAERARQQFQIPRTEAIYRSVLEDAPDEIEVRKKLMIQLDKRKAPADEVLPHLRALAAAAEEAEDSDSARQYLERIISLDPHDLDALERVTRVELDLNDHKDTANALLPYTKTIRNRREYERGVQFLLELAEQRPDDAAPQQEAAHLYLLAGRAQDAKNHYEIAAKLLLQQKKLSQLRKVVDKIEACDERAAMKWRRHLGGNTSRSGRKFALRGALASVVLLLVTCIAFVTYEWDARVSYAEVLVEARGHALGGDLLAAEKALSDFQSQHPYALISRDVANDLRELVQSPVSEATSNQIVGTNRAETTTATVETAPLMDVSTAITNATLLKNRGDYRGALKLYRSIDPAELPELLAETVLLEKKYLEQYLQQAQRMYAEARAARTQNKVEEASRLLLALLDQYPHSGLSAAIQLPIRIDVLPPTAAVYVNNKKLPGPPYLIEVLPEELTTIQVAAPGFTEAHVIVDPRQTSIARVELQKEARWVRSLDASVEAIPHLTKELVFAGTRSGSVIAMSLSKGATVWEYPLQGIGDPLGAIRGWKKDIVFTGTDRALYRVTQATGELVTRIPFPDGSGLTRVALTPPDSSGRTFVITSKGRLLAFDLNSGELIWNRPVGGGGALSPQVVKDRVIVAKREGVVLCLSASDGSQLWQQRSTDQISTNPALGNQTVIVGHENGDLHAFSLVSGQELWQAQTGTPVRALTTLHDDAFAVVDQNGAVTACSTKNGTEVWRASQLGQILGTPVVAGDELLATNDQGQFIAIDLATGARRWQYHVGSRPSCAPMLNATHLVVAGHDHRVHCLRLQ
ncbi:MAG: PQQ-binding-like beta-propeller repeat protein [Planctomycetota bacterium]